MTTRMWRRFGYLSEPLHWTRIVALALVLLHLGVLVLLLAPTPWREPAQATAATAVTDALLVRLLPPRRAPPPTHAVPHAASAPAIRRAAPTALPTHPTRQAAPPSPHLRAPDSLIVTAPPRYIAGGGQFAGPDYPRQGVRLPGSSTPMRGMPVFRMADPRSQGVAGVVRLVQHVLGAVDPQCVALDRARGMTVAERIAQHIDLDALQATASGCGQHLKPGAAMYDFEHAIPALH